MSASTLTMNRIGRNPFEKKAVPPSPLRSPLVEELFAEGKEADSCHGLVNWVTVELPAKVYLTALKAWLLSL